MIGVATATCIALTQIAVEVCSAAMKGTIAYSANAATHTAMNVNHGQQRRFTTRPTNVSQFASPS